ncbi:MAG: amidase [Alphaproteobacteria bacterium]|nr:amidase [Alphaproteobacteria bacterium]
MTRDPDRREIMKGIGATTVASTLASPRPAGAVEDSGASSEWAYQTATARITALIDGTVSSRELVDAAIARIEALDPKINAVVVRDFAAAREAAAAADAALARGERRPLLGLPMTVKEQFNIAGLPTTWGEPKYKDWRPAEDALAVARFKAAGAVILGKTNVPLQLADWQSYNDVYGTTNNPWDLTRTPGGSSGGAAAALAAGFVPLELGSDMGGSLRAPAHYCGVFAHKPSLDLTPLRGGGPPETPAIPTRGDLAVAGPMARSAGDLALALDVLAGPDELSEGIGYRLALPAPRHERLQDFRVLVIDEHPLCPTAASVTGALSRLAERLTRSGCTVLRSSPALPDLARTTQLYVELFMANVGVEMPDTVRAQVESAVKALSPDDGSLTAWRLRGLAIGHPDWVRASRARFGIRDRWQSLFRDVDIVLCPPMPTPAFHQDKSLARTRKLDVDGLEIAYGDQIAWSGIATLSGLPATVAPIDRSESGLPIGVQIIGGYLEDRTTIAFAELIEREYGGFVPPPGLP